MFYNRIENSDDKGGAALYQPKGIDLPKVMALSRKLQTLLGHEPESYVLRAGRSEDLMAAHT